MRPTSGDRTYFVSDERLREFAKLSPLEKLAWIEQCSQFIRLARLNPPLHRPVGELNRFGEMDQTGTPKA